MANAFFGFNTSINADERLGSSPDLEGLEPDEEEYDALNDETFGGLGCDLGDDWEIQHEQLAEIAESSRHSLSESIDQNIESFIDHLGLDDEINLEKRDKSVWEYNSNDSKNGEKNPFLNNSHSNSVKNHFQNEKQPPFNQILFPGQAQQRNRLPSPQQLPKVQTLEEIERMLISQSKPVQNNNAPNNQQFPQHQHGQLPIPPRFPPGFQPVGMPPNLPHHPGPPPQQGPGPHPPPPMGWPHPGGQFPHIPPGLMRVIGSHNRVPPPHIMGPPPGFPHGFPHHPNNGGAGFPPLNQHFNFPPPPRVIQNMNNNRQQNQYHQGQGQQNQQQQKSRTDQQQHQQHRHNSHHHGSGDTKDEYAGLMVNREKQWLLNIQLLQVNTGTPYFDDYYYTVFKERQVKNNKENQSQNANSNNQNYHQHHNGGNRHHHNNHREDNHRHDHRQGHDRDRQQNKEQENPLKGKIYTPLQFENSLGKLQFASVTAPRKIIDMDIINLEKDSDSPATRDSRRTRQLLIELEALYNLLLRAEDLKNPLAISNAEKLKELKQKQRLREIEAAPTPEQKQEVLKLLQLESMAVVENQQDLLTKIVQALLQEEKLQSFVGIRKGKMLLLRLLPQLSIDIFSSQLLEIWIKLLHSISLIGRRDTMGDNILPRFHPYFKRFINICEMNKILEIMIGLRETVKLENSRSTPLSHQSKSPLHFVLTNKFGITSLASILVRVEAIADLCTEKQLSEWSSFLINLTETIFALGTSVANTLEPIAPHIINKHTLRFNTLSQDRKNLIEKVFADTD